MWELAARGGDLRLKVRPQPEPTARGFHNALSVTKQQQQIMFTAALCSEDDKFPVPPESLDDENGDCGRGGHPFNPHHHGLRHKRASGLPVKGKFCRAARIDAPRRARIVVDMCNVARYVAG